MLDGGGPGAILKTLVFTLSKMVDNLKGLGYRRNIMSLKFEMNNPGCCVKDRQWRARKKLILEEFKSEKMRQDGGVRGVGTVGFRKVANFYLFLKKNK